MRVHGMMTVKNDSKLVGKKTIHHGFHASGVETLPIFPLIVRLDAHGDLWVVIGAIKF